MVSCFSSGEVGEAMHFCNVGDEIDKIVSGFWFEAPLLGFFAEMSVAFKRGEDFVDDGGAVWRGAVLGRECDDAVDCCPVFLDRLGRIVTALELEHLLGDFGGSDGAIGAGEMPHELSDRALADGFSLRRRECLEIDRFVGGQ
jgi:hypothetical protein